MFKIDFIVWKQARETTIEDRVYEFKIDFIVWKLTIRYKIKENIDIV